MSGRKFLVLITLCLTLLLSARAEAMIVINEFLADPSTGSAGDSNNDGTTSSSQDEFVELLNAGAGSVDISGWFITDAVNTRHVFPTNTILLPNNYLVVFGGGSPNLLGVDWQTASNGSLGLNNSGDTISLFDQDSNLIDQIIYGSEGGQNQSLARFPDGTGDFALHSTIPLAQGELFSPGAGFATTSTPGTTTVPEPLSALTLALGGIATIFNRKKNI